MQTTDTTGTAPTSPVRRPYLRAARRAAVLAGSLVLLAAVGAGAGLWSSRTPTEEPTGAAGAPVTPQADEARRAAQDELARAVYRDEPGLVSRFWAWLAEHLDPTRAVPGAPAWVSVLVVVLVAALLAGLLLSLLRRTTVAHRAQAPSTSLFTDSRDAAALATAADEAASQADYATAVVERFRAIIRSLDEAGLIDEYPGLTAAEAARAAGGAMRTSGARTGDPTGTIDRLHRAARLFDAVLYGDVVPSVEQDAWMRSLAREIARATSSTPGGVLPGLTQRAGAGGQS